MGKRGKKKEKKEMKKGEKIGFFKWYRKAYKGSSHVFGRISENGYSPF